MSINWAAILAAFSKDYICMIKNKAAVINIFMLTVHKLTRCNVNGHTQSDELGEYLLGCALFHNCTEIYNASIQLQEAILRFLFILSNSLTAKSFLIALEWILSKLPVQCQLPDGVLQTETKIRAKRRIELWIITTIIHSSFLLYQCPKVPINGY